MALAAALLHLHGWLYPLLPVLLSAAALHACIVACTIGDALLASSWVADAPVA